MNLASRRDQFLFFLGQVSRTRKRQLHEAEAFLAKAGFQHVSPEAVFDFCPFNDSDEQILRAYSIFESGKKTALAINLARLLEEYLSLASDFAPPCCGDGRTFYCESSSGRAVLRCDRCGKAYCLGGHPLKETPGRRMSKFDFRSLFGEETDALWPFRLKVLELEDHPSGVGGLKR